MTGNTPKRISRLYITGHINYGKAKYVFTSTCKKKLLNVFMLEEQLYSSNLLFPKQVCTSIQLQTQFSGLHSWLQLKTSKSMLLLVAGTRIGL
jgi:hypothetical protein